MKAVLPDPLFPVTNIKFRLSFIWVSVKREKSLLISAFRPTNLCDTSPAKSKCLSGDSTTVGASSTCEKIVNNHKNKFGIREYITMSEACADSVPHLQKGCAELCGASRKDNIYIFLYWLCCNDQWMWPYLWRYEVLLYCIPQVVKYSLTKFFKSCNDRFVSVYTTPSAWITKQRMV